MDNHDQQVSGILASLDAHFMTLMRHPFVQIAKNGREVDPATYERYEREFLDLLARLSPVTETEKVVAATFRWIASRNRGDFIKSMFQGRYACASLLVDERLTETALGVERAFSINQAAEGYRIGAPRPPPGQRDTGGRRRRNRKGRNRGRRDRDRDSDVASFDGDGGNDDGFTQVRHGRGGRSRDHPVLDEAQRRNLLDELDREADGKAGDDVDGVDGNAATEAERQEDELKKAATDGKASYLDAASGRTSPPKKEESSANVLTFTNPYPPGTSWADMMDDSDDEWAAAEEARKPVVKKTDDK